MSWDTGILIMLDQILVRHCEILALVEATNAGLIVAGDPKSIVVFRFFSALCSGATLELYVFYQVER